MATNADYEIRLAGLDDEQLAPVMAKLCADGRIRAYDMQPGGIEYSRGVVEQLSESGLEELRQQIELAVKSPDTHAFWVAESRADKHLAGLCIAEKVLDSSEPHAYMDRVFVAAADEGNSIATKFLEQLVDWSPGLPIQSEVVVGNERALGLYQHLGFEVVGPQGPIEGFEKELERLDIVKKAKEEVAS